MACNCSPFSGLYDVGRMQSQLLLLKRSGIKVGANFDHSIFVFYHSPQNLAEKPLEYLTIYRYQSLYTPSHLTGQFLLCFKSSFIGNFILILQNTISPLESSISTMEHDRQIYGLDCSCASPAPSTRPAPAPRRTRRTSLTSPGPYFPAAYNMQSMIALTSQYTCLCTLVSAVPRSLVCGPACSDSPLQ